MRRRVIPTRAGLTLIELMITLAITAMVGAAIATLLGAVASGVDTKRDVRSQIVRANVAQSRLGAYLIPARAILHASNTDIVVWYRDSRESNSVHGSEIRWLKFDPGTSTVTVHFVRFPQGWTETQKLMQDREHPKNSNWVFELMVYTAFGLIDTVTLVDGVTGMQVHTDQPAAMDSRHITIRLTLDGSGGDTTSMIAATLLRHHPPAY